MNFNFSPLSRQEAIAMFDSFIAINSATVEQTVTDLKKEGINADFSLETLPDALEWASGKITLVDNGKVNTAEELEAAGIDPRYRLMPSEKDLVFIMRIAYYFGECFIRSKSNLKWGLGKKNTAYESMPVVRGFKNDEFPAFIVCRNLLKERIIEGDKNLFKTIIEVWELKIP